MVVETKRERGGSHRARGRENDGHRPGRPRRNTVAIGYHHKLYLWDMKKLDWSKKKLMWPQVEKIMFFISGKNLAVLNSPYPHLRWGDPEVKETFAVRGHARHVRDSEDAKPLCR